MNTAAMEIRKRLMELADPAYKTFQSKLIPTMNPDCILGVRMPALRGLVKEIEKDPPLTENYLQNLPHQYYDENNVHGVLIAGCMDFEKCISLLEEFLPHIDNWATCDLLVPRVFRGHRAELLPYIEKWIAADHPYTVRFAMKMLMDFYLDDAFRPEYVQTVASVKSEEYYVNMMIAWYFAEAMVTQWDAVIGYFTEPVLGKWTHNKAIQKAIESFRITPEQKLYLKTLKIK